jgi:hypothetical protein
VLRLVVCGHDDADKGLRHYIHSNSYQAGAKDFSSKDEGGARMLRTKPT